MTDTHSSEQLTWKEKIELAKESRKVNGASFYIWRNFAIWLSITLYGGHLVLKNGNSTARFNRGYSDEMYLYTAAVFSMAMVYACISYLGAKNAEIKSLSLILCAVNFVAGSSYVIQFLRLTPSFFDYMGHPVDPSRFFEWFATCPILVYLITELTRNPSETASITASMDYGLILAGFIACFYKQPWSEFWATISSTLYFYTLSNLMMMYNRAIRGETDSKLSKASLYSARFVTFLTWNMFTIVWYIQRSEMVTYEQGEALFCVSDIIAKAFLTLILINANLEEANNDRFDRIAEISSEMERQMAESDKLLAQLIPPSLVEQLKDGKSTGAEEFSSVTVFFSDIPNFAAVTAESSVKNKLASLNNLWREYNSIASKWGIYKVETIGDCFLGVCGAPDRVDDHATRMVNFSIDILKMASNFRTVDGMEIQVRVGLNSGPITAGILGENNPHWCIVGDSVNTASRMESTSKPFMIHITESTFNLVQGKGFKITGPEVMNIKGKGTMNTYWVQGRE